jgi:hypothetical protein
MVAWYKTLQNASQPSVKRLCSQILRPAAFLRRHVHFLVCWIQLGAADFSCASVSRNIFYASLAVLEIPDGTIRYRRLLAWKKVDYDEIVESGVSWVVAGIGYLRLKRFVFPWGKRTLFWTRMKSYLVVESSIPYFGTFEHTPHTDGPKTRLARYCEPLYRLPDITGQSLPVLMASRMMDVLWSDLHISHQSRSSKSGDSFIDLSAPPELKRS